jgi:hypothetical protein
MENKESQIQRIMTGLHCDRQEAEEIYSYDKQIDSLVSRKDIENDLSEEQQQVVKQMKRAERKPTVYDFSKRERKKNIPKATMIAELHEFICANIAENCQIIKPERQLTFEKDGETYELTLTQKRKKK